MTGTPRATASLIAPVTLPASEQEMSAAVAPSLTAWASRCAWTWPSSAGGVSQTISIGTLCFAESSFAAASAPVRADRNTGLVELFAIIAILMPWVRAPAAGAAPCCCSGWRLHPAASARLKASLQVHLLIVIYLLVDSVSIVLFVSRGPTPAKRCGAPPPQLPAPRLARRRWSATLSRLDQHSVEYSRGHIAAP